MTDQRRADSGERAAPDGSAWADAQRQVAERNDRARKEGKKEQQAYERRVAALRRAARDKA